MKKNITTFRNVAIGLSIVFASCATPPGQIIGDTVCDCLHKTGGDRAKIRICMAQFQADIKAELVRQHVPEASNNEEAARAMSIMSLCMSSVVKSDTLHPQHPIMPKPSTAPEMTPPVPPK